MKLSKEIFIKLRSCVGFLSKLDDEDLFQLLKLAESEKYSNGDIVFRENTRGHKMYIILSGVVRISKSFGNNTEQTLVKLAAGDCFGEMGLIDQSPRSATATVEGGPAVLLAVNEGILSENNILLAYKIYKAFARDLAQKIRITNAKFQDTGIGHSDHRAAVKTLLRTEIEKGNSLGGANFRGADLSGVSMDNADIQHSLLIGAKMSAVTCKQANFTGAKFINADIKFTTFHRDNFENADFSGAKFDKVEFVSCNLQGAVFRGADLSGARGLGPDKEQES